MCVWQARGAPTTTTTNTVALSQSVSQSVVTGVCKSVVGACESVGSSRQHEQKKSSHSGECQQHYHHLSVTPSLLIMIRRID